MITQLHTGAVCYIDLLGFSYLTNLLENKELYNDNSKGKKFSEKCVKDLTLSDLRFLIDYVKFENPRELSAKKDSDITISEWAYTIVDSNLKRFHEIVKKTCNSFQNVEYSVISDSLFIASECADDILFILSNVFRECIKSGILLRAGLAFGTYYSVKTSISSFNIYGTAVTKAVNYEKLGKGCRIFTDSELPRFCKLFSEINSKLFHPYKNYQNYSTLDCFEWLMIKDDYVFRPYDLRNLITSNDFQKALNLLYDNVEILCEINYSPNFNWNLKTEQGIEQLGASIEYVSNSIDKIYELYAPENLSNMIEKIEDGKDFIKSSKRSETIVMKMIDLKKKGINDSI